MVRGVVVSAAEWIKAGGGSRRREAREGRTERKREGKLWRGGGGRELLWILSLRSPPRLMKTDDREEVDGCFDISALIPPAAWAAEAGCGDDSISRRAGRQCQIPETS